MNNVHWGKGAKEFRFINSEMERRIGYVIVEWKKECNLNKSIVQFSKRLEGGVLMLFTTHPALMIGEKGKYLNKYTDKIKEIDPSIKQVGFMETSSFIAY